MVFMNNYFKINMCATFILSVLLTFYSAYKMTKDGMLKAQPYFIFAIALFISSLIMFVLLIIKNSQRRVITKE